MSKTAMQELIDKYNKGCGSREFFTYFITNKNELLAKERQQIIDAAKYGLEYPMVLNGSDGKAEDYYNQTYNNEP